jgi:hypothetical protein
MWPRKWTKVIAADLRSRRRTTGYTLLKIICRDTDKKVVYYATELMNGNRRYDYALIDFVGDDGSTQSCP